eukprot:gene5160-8766_t
MKQEILKFDSNFTQNNLKLFHFPEDILDEILTKNINFEIKGEKEGTAYFITKNKTFKIVKYETSNCLLLKNEQNIEGESDCHFEIEQIIPDLSLIFNLLKDNYYQEIENKNKKNYTFKNLKDLLIASENEILEKLKEIGCIELKSSGHWKLIDPKWIESALDILLLLIHEKGWNLKKLSFSKIKEELKNENEIILNQIFSIYGNHLSDDLKEISFEKISIFRSNQLFENKIKWKVSDFLLEWKKSLSDLFESEELNLNLISDHCLFFDENMDEYLIYINPKLISSSGDPKQLIQNLFSIQNEWKENDIKKFLKKSINDPSQINKTLLKFSKSKQTSNGKIYMKK